MANRLLTATTGETQHLAGVHRRRTSGAGGAGPRALFGMGAHPFLTLTLFIAMFERDHGPLEYQLAYGAAMKHLTFRTPTSRPDMRAALLQAYASPPVGEHPAGAGGRDGRWSGQRRAGRARWTCCARAGRRTSGQPALPYVPGVQGVGGSCESPALAAGTRVWFATSAGMAPGDGSLAEPARSGRGRGAARRRSRRRRGRGAIGTSGIAAWMCLTWRAGLQPGERVARPGRRRSGRAGGDRGGPFARRGSGRRGLPVGGRGVAGGASGGGRGGAARGI